MTDETFELTVSTMASGGRALGRHDKKTVFVPYTIPGETIIARVVQDKGRVLFAEGVQLVEASADRVFPACPHFGPGRCDGCQWQHIAYSAQALIKQDVLADQLARVGGFDDADVRDIIPSPTEWGYRHHMTFQRTATGWAVAGHHPHTLDVCHILHPDLVDLLARADLEAEAIHTITLQIGTDGDHMLMLHLVDEDDAPELSSDLKTSVNLLLPDDEPVNLIGDTHSRYQINGRAVRVTAGSPLRPNVAALGALAECVAAQVPEDGAALDLYAGVGLFGLFIAPRVPVLTLVTAYPPAATDAEHNLAEYDHVDIIEGDALDVLDVLDDAQTTYQTAVIDTPAGGLDVALVDALAESGIPRLVVIGDDPALLARDLGRLVKQGYTLGAVYPFDLEPQTHHVSAVAVLDRGSA
ncbi:MAG: class I SAM-dependent RNA methyltransferase [Anaerolineaceae bacterium]|nr:MAG: class I SAM-dependent RNA methyltransferase [Anaerolineaceae bacterium]